MSSIAQQASGSHSDAHAAAHEAIGAQKARANSASGRPRAGRKADGPGWTGSRTKLLEAAIALVREKGFHATSVDDLCRHAGVTKGAFFHHFSSKEALGAAAAHYWSEMTGAFFAHAPYQSIADPYERLLGYIDFRSAILQGEVRQFTCYAGTLVQETYAAFPALREACARSIGGHAETLEPMIEAALAARGLRPDWSAQSLALHSQAVIQGAFILAKAQDSAAVAADMIGHLRRYVTLLFQPNPAFSHSPEEAQHDKAK